MWDKASSVVRFHPVPCRRHRAGLCGGVIHLYLYLHRHLPLHRYLHLHLRLRFVFIFICIFIFVFVFIFIYLIFVPFDMTVDARVYINYIIKINYSDISHGIINVGANETNNCPFQRITIEPRTGREATTKSGGELIWKRRRTVKGAVPCERGSGSHGGTVIRGPIGGGCGGQDGESEEIVHEGSTVPGTSRKSAPAAVSVGQVLCRLAVSAGQVLCRLA